MENRAAIWRFTMNYGAILGLVFIAMSYFSYLMPFSIKLKLFLFLVNAAIWIGAIVLGIKRFRDNYLDGFIDYGVAFYTGMLSIFFASIIFAAYNYVFLTYIAPEYPQQIIESTKEWMIGFMQDFNMPDDQIEAQLQIIDSKPIASPLQSAKQTIIWNTVVGIVLSLIIAAFMKNEPQPTS